MNAFVQKYSSKIIGILSGFDRLLLRGVLRRLAYEAGMFGYLCGGGVYLKDFRQHAIQVTEQLKQASLEHALEANRPVRYLSSNRLRKEDIARKIAHRDGVTEGLVCVLKCLELCRSWTVVKNPQTHRLQLKRNDTKCLHLYHYLIHPRFGFMHVRLQTWFPFDVQIWINGREWLSRQLDGAGIGYRRRDNCFTWIEDFSAAQKLMDGQQLVDWPEVLDQIIAQVHPAHCQIFPAPPPPLYPLSYYWTVGESEWATDVTFRSRELLKNLWPHLVRYGITTFGPQHVMRFLGKKVNQDGSLPAWFNGEITSDVKNRPEGTRLKFWLNQNSQKMYDKWNTLRCETTLNNPRDFKVYRPATGDPDGPKTWRPLRKSVADIRRRAEVCQAANERMIDAQAAVTDDQTLLKELAEPLCRRVRITGRVKPDGTRSRSRSYRGLNPLAKEDAVLLLAISRPEFHQNGFRNRDLYQQLYRGRTRTKKEQRRRSAAITRQLALLRAHGLIQKVSKTHRYTINTKARRALTALLAARDATTSKLTTCAA